MDGLARDWHTDVRHALGGYVRKYRGVLVTALLCMDGRTAQTVIGQPPPALVDVEPQRRLYQIGSVTKVFTALLLAAMERDGRAAEQTLLQDVLPQGWRAPAFKNEQITLGHLATHTSGLPRLPNNLGFRDTFLRARNPYSRYTQARLRSFLQHYSLGVAPGTRWRYSNLGAGVLGFALGSASGTTYEQAIADWITQPLSLPDTVVELSAEQRARTVPGRRSRGGRTPAWNMGILQGAGALFSTAGDLERLVRLQLGLLDAGLGATARATHRVRYDTEFTLSNQAQALGWLVVANERHPDRVLYWHNGRTGGYEAFVGFVPAVGTGIVLLSNVAERGQTLTNAGVSLMRDYAVPPGVPDDAEDATVAQAADLDGEGD